MKKSVTSNQKDSLSKKGKGGLPFETEKLDDEVVRKLQSLPHIYDRAHSMHMKSCFEHIHPSLWEKYLDIPSSCLMQPSICLKTLFPAPPMMVGSDACQSLDTRPKTQDRQTEY